MKKKSAKGKKRHVFIVSDATGSTCELVVNAALTQFKTSRAVLHRVRQVRDVDQVSEVIRDAQKVQGIVVYTLVVPELRKAILTGGRHHAVPTIDILGPVLSRLTDLLELSPMAKPGLFKGLDQDYFERIEAMNFAIKHDDGLRPGELPQADLVLVGVSRTSKTPISIYLSYRGFKVANVPIVLDTMPPKQLFEIEPYKVIGLTIRPQRLQLLRKARAEGYGMDLPSYTNMRVIRKELHQSMDIFQEQGWQTFDVTLRSIEEAATVIMELLGKHVVE
jgi:regulator of PEP synthase PpsR (kinase-PPPase family)